MINASMILIVEDEANVRTVLADVLRPLARAVLEAENGEKALALLEAHPVRLVVIDFVLPDVDGLSLINRLREERPQIPIILISGYLSQPAGDDMLAKTGARLKYLAKPFRPAELTATVQNLLDASPS